MWGRIKELLGAVSIRGDSDGEGYPTVGRKRLSQLRIDGHALGNRLDAVTGSLLVRRRWGRSGKRLGSWAARSRWLPAPTRQVAHAWPQVLYHITAWDRSLWPQTWCCTYHNNKYNGTHCTWRSHSCWFKWRYMMICVYGCLSVLLCFSIYRGRKLRDASKGKLLFFGLRMSARNHKWSVTLISFVK